MDKLDFTTLKQVLLHWPTMALPQAGDTTTPLLGRLRQIIEPARRDGTFSSLPDLMVLVRQLLLSRGGDKTGQRLSVPRHQGWPGEDLWETFGFHVMKTATRFGLEAKAWHPDWLGPTGGHADDLFQHEHQAQCVRLDSRLPIDPFLREVTGFNHYLCPGQREAILSALFMTAGDSLIVNLPTGSGKSLVAQAPVLIHGPERGLTLVVVPTNALALDLERRTREFLTAPGAVLESSQEFAWIGAPTDDSHEAIKQRIRSGSQGILFSSPEAVCGSLLNSLYIAAEQGLLAYFVVDEAHLIAQWGDAFRPAFQQLSGVRRGLLAACLGERFRTLLLSATFSHQIIETLKVLFGPSENLNIASAVHLRPEPRYLSYRCLGSHDKEVRVDELLRYVPRPFILYTTKRTDAKAWFQRLLRTGFRRIACVHGETPNAERERIIWDWVYDRIDGVVATSAFGVGMDKSDVRTVIHAAMPETLDRLYQEVGRGGRDGRASLSITVFDTPDISIARSLSVPTLIGDEKGFERWSTLYREAERDSRNPDVRLVDLRKRPGGLTQESDYNRDWNMRTLILLARAGLIQLESTRPLQIERDEGEDETAFRARLEVEQEAYFARIPVRALDPRLMDRSYFEFRVGAERQRGRESANRAFDRMLEALSGQREIAKVLVELLASDNVIVSPACRGCPASNGALHKDGNLYQIPSGIGISRVAPYDMQGWRDRFGDLDPSRVVVLCPESTADRLLLKALRSAIASFGVRELAVQQSVRHARPAFSELHRWSDDRVLALRDLSDTLPSPDTLSLARATVFMPWSDQPLPDELWLFERPLHLVFASSNIRDGHHPLRLYRDTATNCIEFQEFLRRATQ